MSCFYETLKLQRQWMWSEWSHKDAESLRLNVLGYDAPRWQWGWYSLDMTHQDESVWSLGYDAPRRIKKIDGYYTPLKEKWESFSRFQKSHSKAFFFFNFNGDYNL